MSKSETCVYLDVKKALINIEKIKPYCSRDDYNLIVSYLNNPSDEVRLAARSAASLSASMEENKKDLRDLFVKWENGE